MKQMTRPTDHAEDCEVRFGFHLEPLCTCGLEYRKRIFDLEQRVAELLDIIEEYECQWGDEYLAKKWGLKERKAALLAAANEAEG